MDIPLHAQLRVQQLPTSWQEDAGARLQALAQVFLDPEFASSEVVAHTILLARARARALAVIALGAPRTCEEFWAATEALDRSMTELKAAVAGIATEPWWTYPHLVDVVLDR